MIIRMWCVMDNDKGEERAHLGGGTILQGFPSLPTPFIPTNNKLAFIMLNGGAGIALMLRMGSMLNMTLTQNKYVPNYCFPSPIFQY